MSIYECYIWVCWTILWGWRLKGEIVEYNTTNTVLLSASQFAYFFRVSDNFLY